MARKKNKYVLYETVKDDGQVPIQHLPIRQQIRMLLKRMFHNSADELKAEDVVTKEELKRRANLISFIDKATKPIREKGMKRVTFTVNSTMENALDYITKFSKYTRFYDFYISKADNPYGIVYDIVVTMQVKEAANE